MTTRNFESELYKLCKRSTTYEESFNSLLLVDGNIIEGKIVSIREYLEYLINYLKLEPYEVDPDFYRNIKKEDLDFIEESDFIYLLNPKFLNLPDITFTGIVFRIKKSAITGFSESKIFFENI